MCDHATYSDRYLAIHISIQHKKLPNQYKCEICGKESKLLAIHEKHKKTHSDELEYTCDMCAKGYRTMISLKLHLFKIHGVDFDEKEKESMVRYMTKKPQVKPVNPECQKCNRRSFIGIEDFNNHVLNCYGRQLLEIDFSCNKKECSRRKWNSAEVLHYHIYTEHQASDRVCDMCGKIIKCPWNTNANLLKVPSIYYVITFKMSKCQKKNVQECPQLSEDVQECPQMSKNVHKCPRMSKKV